MVTSDGWEVKLGLVKREDEVVVSPWILEIILVAYPPRNVLGSLSAEFVASGVRGCR